MCFPGKNHLKAWRYEVGNVDLAKVWQMWWTYEKIKGMFQSVLRMPEEISTHPLRLRFNAQTMLFLSFTP
jgi:hypothetical protein